MVSDNNRRYGWEAYRNCKLRNKVEDKDKLGESIMGSLFSAKKADAGKMQYVIEFY